MSFNTTLLESQLQSKIDGVSSSSSVRDLLIISKAYETLRTEILASDIEAAGVAALANLQSASENYLEELQYVLGDLTTDLEKYEVSTPAYYYWRESTSADPPVIDGVSDPTKKQVYIHIAWDHTSILTAQYTTALILNVNDEIPGEVTYSGVKYRRGTITETVGGYESSNFIYYPIIKTDTSKIDIIAALTTEIEIIASNINAILSVSTNAGLYSDLDMSADTQTITTSEINVIAENSSTGKYVKTAYSPLIPVSVTDLTEVKQDMLLATQEKAFYPSFGTLEELGPMIQTEAAFSNALDSTSEYLLISSPNWTQYPIDENHAFARQGKVGIYNNNGQLVTSVVDPDYDKTVAQNGYDFGISAAMNENYIVVGAEDFYTEYNTDRELGKVHIFSYDPVAGTSSLYFEIDPRNNSLLSQSYPSYYIRLGYLVEINANRVFALSNRPASGGMVAYNLSDQSEAWNWYNPANRLTYEITQTTELIPPYEYGMTYDQAAPSNVSIKANDSYVIIGVPSASPYVVSPTISNAMQATESIIGAIKIFNEATGDLVRLVWNPAFDINDLPIQPNYNWVEYGSFGDAITIYGTSVYVSDIKNKKIFEIDISSGSLVSEISSSANDATFGSDIAVDTEYIYISSYGNSSIYLYKTSDKSFVGTIEYSKTQDSIDVNDTSNNAQWGKKLHAFNGNLIVGAPEHRNGDASFTSSMGTYSGYKSGRAFEISISTLLDQTNLVLSVADGTIKFRPSSELESKPRTSGKLFFLSAR